MRVRVRAKARVRVRVRARVRIRACKTCGPRSSTKSSSSCALVESRSGY